MVGGGLVGHTYPPAPAYEVGTEKVREFATAVGAVNPIHHDPGAARQVGFTGVVAPFTFAAIIAQRAEFAFTSLPEANVDFSRVVHASDKIDYVRPIVAGDVISAQLTVDSVTERGANTFVTTRCKLTDVGGAPVAQVISTLAVRGQ